MQNFYYTDRRLENGVDKEDWCKLKYQDSYGKGSFDTPAW